MLELVSSHACHGGEQRFYRHDSKAIGLPMKFSVYLPPQAAHGRVPALFYLAGLTCTEETFAIKGGAQQYAARHGLALVMPDTSPRGADVPGEADAWDFGVGAGFYVDATQAPWSTHYRMESYVTGELRAPTATRGSSTTRANSSRARMRRSSPTASSWTRVPPTRSSRTN